MGPHPRRPSNGLFIIIKIIKNKNNFERFVFIRYNCVFFLQKWSITFYTIDLDFLIQFKECPFTFGDRNFFLFFKLTSIYFSVPNTYITYYFYCKLLCKWFFFYYGKHKSKYKWVVSELFIALCTKDISHDNRFKDHNILCGLWCFKNIICYNQNL